MKIGRWIRLFWVRFMEWKYSESGNFGFAAVGFGAVNWTIVQQKPSAIVTHAGFTCFGACSGLKILKMRELLL